MGILARVEEIRSSEHQRLRNALMAVGDALHDAEETEVEAHQLASMPVRKVDMFGNPIDVESTSTRTPVPPRRDFGPVMKAWDPVEELVLRRLDQWEEVLWPLVARWDAGEEVEDAIQKVANDLAVARESVDRHLRILRNQALFLKDLAEPMRALFAAVELCDRAEREEVIPALLSGSRDSADRTERSQSADDVSRNLRAALRAPKPPEPPKPPLVRFLSWMGVLPNQPR
jgi:hypothetical protein